MLKKLFAITVAVSTILFSSGALLAHASVPTSYSVSGSQTDTCGHFCGVLIGTAHFTFDHLTVYAENSSGDDSTIVTQFSSGGITSCGYGFLSNLAASIVVPAHTTSMTAFTFDFTSDIASGLSDWASRGCDFFDATTSSINMDSGIGMNQVMVWCSGTPGCSSTTFAETASDPYMTGNSYAGSAIPIMDFTTGAPTPPVDTDNLLKWYSPYESSSTPDFSNWTLKTSGSALSAAGATTVCLWVQYSPVSTPGEIFVDECDPSLAYSTSSLGANTLIFLPKTIPLTAEDWTARAWLVDQDGTTVIAQTSTITFTVTSGTATTYATAPPPTTDDFTADCTSDGSTIGDIKSAFCTTVRDLFVPSSDALSQYSTLPAMFQTHAPFSYFYNVKDAITNLDPSSSDISGLTITTGGAIPISVDMFSSTTIDKYTSSGTRATLRTLIQYSLYLAFVYLVFHEVRKLFRKQ
jgi:hypothetical protein